MFRARQKGDSKREKPDPERTFSQIFGSLCKSRDLGVADLRRKLQETADFRRKPQKTADFCRNRFLPFAVSLLARSYMFFDCDSKCGQKMAAIVLLSKSTDLSTQPVSRFKKSCDGKSLAIAIKHL